MNFYRLKGLFPIQIGPYQIAWKRIVGIKIGNWFFGAIKGSGFINS